MDLEDGTPIDLPSYKYSPLDENNQEIRLLTLLPGKWQSAIQLRLEATTFTEDHVPQYEAVSYAWGSTEDPVNVVIISNSGQSILPITQNLAQSLPYLRYEDKPRVLWVDAICVNQQDLAERSGQVKRMAEIFTNAMGVVAWLGPESYDSAVAIELLRTIGSNLEVNWRFKLMNPTSTEEHWADMETLLPFHAFQGEAIHRLLSRPWFERLWVWQEVCLPSRDVFVMCGSRTILWKRVRDAIYCIWVKRKPTFSAYQIKRLEVAYRLCGGTANRPFYSLIEKTKDCKCSDPREKVFALISMLDQWDKRIGIQADYTKTVSEVYQDAVIRYIGYVRNLRILSTVEIDDDQEGLPSWVPNLTVPHALTSMSTCLLASGISKVEEFSHQEGKLQLTGVSVDALDVLEPFRLLDIDWEGYGDTIRELRRMALVMGLSNELDHNPVQFSNLSERLLRTSFLSDSITITYTTAASSKAKTP